MSLTDADLGAMLERCEAVHTEAVRENSPWNPWFMGQAEILATDLPAVIRELQAAREREAALLAEGRLLKEATEDLLGGWRYIRQAYGDLYGVGWGRAQHKGEQALSGSPLVSAEVERVKAMEKVAEAAMETLMWNGERCPHYPERDHPYCETCGQAVLCAALAALGEKTEARDAE